MARTVLFISYLGFISLGLPDTLIGVAWPSVRQHFHLQQSDVAWIFFGVGATYFISSFFAGRLLRIWNVGVLLALSSGLVALSGFNYAAATVWAVFVMGALLHGFGSGAIDTGLNHYVASHFSARHMNWLHACYSLGAMLGPLVMTAAITRRGSYRAGYLGVAIALAVLSLLFFLTRKQWDSTPQSAEEPSAGVTAGTVLRTPLVWFHIVLFFVYTGLEVAVGQWSFTVLTESRNVTPQVAGLWVTIYWACILAGRIGFGFVVDRIGIDSLIRGSTIAALAGTLLFAWNPFVFSAPIALGLAGFGLAAIFPSLMTRTPQRLGKAMAAHAIGFQVGAAMIGAAALPSVAGWVAQKGLHLVPAAILVMALLLLLVHEAVLRLRPAQ